MRTIAVVTSARADYGIYLPLLKRVKAEPDLDLQLIVTGMHLSPYHGFTVEQIEADGFTVHHQVESLLASDRPEGISKAMGLGVIGFSQVFAQNRPDILMILGDRFEMAAAPLAALPFGIPVAHIHGGEVTQGAIDDSLRHAITKLSHIHFVSTEEYARRVIQLGEEPWRVIVSGAMGLDNLAVTPILEPDALAEKFGIPLEPAPLLITFHPVTLEVEQTQTYTAELLAVLEQFGSLPLIFTLPNADTGSTIITAAIHQFVAQHSHAYLVENFGTAGYFGMLKQAAAMVGNSSSGILEAASFGLPVVNIGTRQAGRVRAANVIDVGYSRQEILSGLQQALDPAFRKSISGITNPYQQPRLASDIILEQLKTLPLDRKLIEKVFYDVLD